MPRSAAGTEAFAGSDALRSARTLREARAFCARLAREHYENFPVASRLVPRHLRPAIEAIYAFARIADDFADEEAHEGYRLERLEEWGRMLDDCFRGVAIHPVFVALQESICGFDLPRQPFVDLLAAFRLDVTKTRHADEDSLLEYCRLSANPVGRLLLRLFGYTEEGLLPMSDAFCTGLQLANHWQDVAIDLGRGRIYLPEDARSRFGVTEADLREGKATGAFRALMRDRVDRTRALFETGRPLCDTVRGRFRWELRLTWLGGQRILDRIEACGYDVLSGRPRLGRADALVILGRAAAWSS
jgi:hydroxysqualene synthase